MGHLHKLTGKLWLREVWTLATPSRDHLPTHLHSPMVLFSPYGTIFTPLSHFIFGSVPPPTKFPLYCFSIWTSFLIQTYLSHGALYPKDQFLPNDIFSSTALFHDQPVFAMDVLPVDLFSMLDVFSLLGSIFVTDPYFLQWPWTFPLGPTSHPWTCFPVDLFSPHCETWNPHLDLFSHTNLLTPGTFF